MYKLKVEKLPDSEALITGELPLEVLEKARSKALKHLNSHTKIPGFREGSVPESVLVKSLGEMRVLEEVAEVALGEEYANIIREAKLEPVGRPEIAITKLAPGIPLEFKMTVTLEPEFDLPDYKAIAKNTPLPPTPSPEARRGGEGGEVSVEEQKFWNKEKHRITILESLIDKTAIKVPKLIVEFELNKMLARFEDDVRAHGLKYEDYLKSINKTEDDIKKEWHEKAERHAKAELIIGKIAEAEKISPTLKELESEINHILSHHKDADPMRVRIYAYQLIRNQKVLEFLETTSTGEVPKETTELEKKDGEVDKGGEQTPAN